jgi:hypothetical protein
MKKNIVMKDDFGLYVIAGGWVSRPFFGTMFIEGVIVKSHHFGGSTKAGVTLNEKEYNFKNGKYEYWETTGIIDTEMEDKRKIMNPDMYLGKTWDQIHQELYDWYKEKCRSTSFIYEEHNKKFWNIGKNK